MPWGPRVIETSTSIAEGDKFFYQAQYNDVSGNLTEGMPVYKDLTDPAEYGFINTTTQVTVGPLAKLQSAGRVVTATSTLARGVSSGGGGNLLVGAYCPTNPTDKPSTGDVIRIMRTGACPVQISTGFNPAVGDYIVASDTQNLFGIVQRLSGNTPSVMNYAGRVLGTGNAISVGATVPLVTASGTVGFLINGWIDK